MKKISVLGIILIQLLSMSIHAFEWETDFAKASAEAKKTGKYILMDFAGSDWCGWCIKLEKEVFSQEDFKQFADKNFVCILVDFPNKKVQTKELKEQNSKLAEKYRIQGYPTIIILDPKGEFAGQTGYQEGGAKKYTEHLKAIVDKFKEKTKKQK
ncbi:MAG: thioredoxin family protein [bacterium]|nr:thioredoxin family protein [bacterium]